MENSNGMILIDKDQYYKTYIEQREKLHFNLVQQLLVRADAKKQNILNKSSEIIERFIQYRDEFLKNMPNELKALKVNEYLNRSQGSLQGLIQHQGDDTINSLYKIFHSEFEKVHNANKKTVIINQNRQEQNADKMEILNKEKPKPIEVSEGDETVLEFIDIIKENQNTKPKPERNKQSAMKSKTKAEVTPVKSNKKRKWDQFTSNGKENKTINLNLTKGKGTKGEQFKNANIEKTNAALVVTDINKAVSPMKKPWMP